MFDRRLLSLVDRSAGMVAAVVALKWLALAADIAIFVSLGLFVQAVALHSAAIPSGGGDMLSGVSLSSKYLVVICAAAVSARVAATFGAQRMSVRVAGAAKKSIRSAVYGKLLALGPSYKERISSSQAVQIGVEGVEQLEVYFGSYLPQFFYAILAPITLFAALAPLSLPAAIALFACVPLIPASIMMFQKLAKKVMRRYWGSYLDLGESFLENIQGLTTLKIYRADAARHEAMNAQAESFRRATMRVLRLQLNSITIMDVLAYGGAAVGICIAVWQFSAGTLSFAAAFSIVFLSAEFFLPMRSLGSLFHTAMNGMAAADRMFDLLDLDVSSQRGVSLEGRAPEISCEGASYSYDGVRQVLRDVDFRAAAGEFVAIVGESGSGKSTLAGVLAGRNARFEGDVRVCGVSVREADRSSLARALTCVGFDSVLFKGTLRSNLLMACPHADDMRLKRALMHARAWDFVQESGGLDMEIAEGGGNLSGGQRQRLALARAFLHDTPLYLFDEVTSNIDAESEEAVLESIRDLAGSGKTVVMISHRLSSIEDADRIYVMQDGRVVQEGSHEALMGEPGVYRRMVERQRDLERLVEGRRAEKVDDARLSAASCEEEPACLVVGEEELRAARAEKRNASAFRIVSRMMGIVAPLAWCMALAVLLGVAGFVASMAVTVAGAYFMGQAAEGVQVAFFTAAAAIVFAALLRGPLHYGEQICNHYIAFKLLALIRDKVFAALRMLAPAKLEGRDKGDLMSLATADIELLEVFYAHTVSPVLIAAAMAAGLAVALGAQSVWFAILALVLYAMISLVIPAVSSRLCGASGRLQRDAVGDMNSYMLESLRGVVETIQYGRERDRARGLDERMDALHAVSKKLAMRTAFGEAATDAVVIAGDAACAILGASLVASGSIGFAQFLFAQALLMSSFGPFIAVSRLGATLQQTLASGERVLELLDEKPQTEEVEKGVALQGFTGSAARDVSFGYGGVEVLRNVDMSVSPGEVVQIQGRSGSGKSTLCKLLMRFWDPDSGAVEMSGCDLRAVNTASLRAMQSYMTQQTHLFAGTLRENIAMVRPDASDEDVLEACRKADILALVERLEHGLQTQVGELGSSLSGGERQRIGLARVFLHDAPFVLLDEPTSNLDSLSEAQVLESLRRHREGKAMVLVSHRASTSSLADVCYTVDHGRRS